MNFKIKPKIGYFLRQSIGNKNYGKFIVLGRSRVGSNWFMSLLNSHKNVKAHGEIFFNIGNKSCNEIWSKTLSKDFPWVKSKGFKIFYYHPLDSSDKNVWKYLNEDKNIKIIHLKRRNLLDIHLSWLIADKNDIWASIWTDEGKESIDKRVVVDVKEMFKDFKRTENWIKSAETQFSNHRMINVFYDELKDNQQITMNKVFEFLEVSTHEVESKLRKQNPEKYIDLIKNFEEVKMSLKDTSYEWFLNKRK